MFFEETRLSNDAVKLLYPSWVYNENLQAYEPPIPMPEDGQEYVWDEKNTNWCEINAYYKL